MKTRTYDLAVVVGKSGGAQQLCVTGRGDEVSADQIVRLARRSGIPVVEDGILCSWLSEFELWDLIPPRLLFIIARTLKHL